MIIKVDSGRFHREFQKSVQQEPNNQVEWFVDEENIHMYIFTGAKIFYFTSNKNDIPEKFKIDKMITKAGVILGFVEQKPIVIEEKGNIIEDVEREKLNKNIKQLKNSFKDLKA